MFIQKKSLKRKNHYSIDLLIYKQSRGPYQYVATLQKCVLHAIVLLKGPKYICIIHFFINL